MGVVYKLTNQFTGSWYIGYSAKTPSELKKNPPRPQQAEYVWNNGRNYVRLEILEEAANNLPLLRDKWRAHYSPAKQYTAKRNLILQKNDQGVVVDSFISYQEFCDKYGLKLTTVMNNLKKYGLEEERPTKRDYNRQVQVPDYNAKNKALAESLGVAK